MGRVMANPVLWDDEKFFRFVDDNRAALGLGKLTIYQWYASRESLHKMRAELLDIAAAEARAPVRAFVLS